MNKQGQITFGIRMLIAKLLVLTVFGILVLQAIMSSYGNAQLDTAKVENEMLYSRLIYSSSAISYVDNTGRVYSGVIDWDKFNDEHLERGIKYSHIHSAAKLSLIDDENEIIKTAYLHKQRYQDWSARAKSGLLGIGVPKYTMKRSPVTVYFRGNMSAAVLQVELVAKG